ncbi:aromatic ring-hydroxylating oxygenase subunit alpha [Roseovarius pelagicus]|uniref:Aromatic ring-hydroxylating dioxygenase subunit alpha n=1 Tax=Roseovarius pelagicus TaxID=2980108 RepID=A0ABY6DF43_9RHOB|nr:aromatic ring-hydroxylating dioxygenase subunit alpha [Roseovarius pelagicus]UXX84772.1 aromatic ring-hydroxylating dioxygenase subunit alpha [Roseovarius pelagicus]
MNKPFKPAPSIDLDDLQTNLDQGWGFPANFYSDPDIYDFDMKHIYNKSWLLFAPVHQLSEPGDTVVGRAGDVPVVVVRGRDNVLRGFVNLCRHRGYTVATETGKCNTLTCRYHAWSYNLDGSLRGAPNTKQEPGFDKSEMSLLPIAVDTWGPAVFVNADPEATPFLAHHPKIADYTRNIGYETDPQFYLDNYNLVRTIDYDFQSNWKLWYDNNTECYHCPTIHSTSFGDAFETNIGAFTYEEFDNCMTFSFSPDARPAEHGKLKARSQRAFQFYPGSTIMRQDDLLLLHQAIPTGPETSKKFMYCLLRKGSDTEMGKRWIDLWDQTFSEDQGATQIQQAGLRSGRMPRARYVTNQEEATMFVNRLTLSAYRKALTGE